ncbi:MAG: hypothetical protein AAB675_03085 [Patescibacteria group bacterium]
MRKESFISMTRNTAVLLPLVLGACKGGGETQPSPTQLDFSEYVPIIVSMRDSEDYCLKDKIITYHLGEPVELLDLQNGEVVSFELEIEENIAVFSTTKTKYKGGVKEGEVFGLLTDKEGRGANPIGKLIDVGTDSISVEPIDRDCTQA